MSDIMQSIGVYDTMFGASDEQSAWELYSNLKEVFRSGSFNLWKFAIYQELSLQECINRVEWIITVNTGVEQLCSDADTCTW